MKPPIERFVMWLPGEPDPLDLSRRRPRRRAGGAAFYVTAVLVTGAAVLVPWPGAEAARLIGGGPGALVIAALVGMIILALPGRHRGRAVTGALAIAATFLSLLPGPRGATPSATLLAGLRATTARLLPALAGGPSAEDGSATDAEVWIGSAPAVVRIDPDAAQTGVSLVDLTRAGLELDAGGRLVIPRLTVGRHVLENVDARLLTSPNARSVLGRDVLDRLAGGVAPAASSP